MRVNINQEVLLQGVSQALGAVDRKGSLPILAHCLIQTSGRGLEIAATDLEIFFQGHYQGQVSESGGTAVQANILHNLLKSLPKGDLGLAVNQDTFRMTIEASGLKYELLGVDLQQFPSMPELAEVGGAEKLEVKSRIFTEMICKTIFSVSEEPYQSHLHGIFWEMVELAGEPWLRMVSSDGHRLTIMERPVPGIEKLNLGSGVIIPAKGARQICRFLEGGGSEAVAEVALSNKSLALKDNDTALYIRLGEKKFPDYRRIIPDQFIYRFTVNRQDLIMVLRRLALLSPEKFKGVVLDLTEDSMEITSDNPEVGEGKELLSITAEVFEPEPKEAEEFAQGDADGKSDHENEDPGVPSFPLRISFNVRYLLEPLHTLKGERVTLEIGDPKRPCRIMDPNDPHYFGLVMPMDI
jgi:DNA polymerase III subunit beta